MDEFVVVLRLTEASPALPGGAVETVQRLLGGLPGVKTAVFDSASSECLIRYDPAAISLGDLVRCMGDYGLRVDSIAQTRVPSVAPFARTA